MAFEATTMKKAPIEPAVSLVPACLAGDPKARETLARWCLPKIRRTVMLAYGTGPDADDLCQVAIARVFERLDSYRGDASFYTWVDRIAVNVTRDHYRSVRARSAWEVLSPPTVDASHGKAGCEPDEAYGRYELMERLSVHLSRIKLDRRLPLVLTLAQGYTAPEIAAMLGVHTEAVKKRLQRGREELLGLLKKDPHLLSMMSERMR
jgi:RNA polymerase sigma-70 factor (ECF subfamily)